MSFTKNYSTYKYSSKGLEFFTKRAYTLHLATYSLVQVPQTTFLFLVTKDAMAFFLPLRLSGHLNFDSRACQEWPLAIPGVDAKRKRSALVRA
jgi:hypothetical protein